MKLLIYGTQLGLQQCNTVTPRNVSTLTDINAATPELLSRSPTLSKNGTFRESLEAR